METIFIVGGAAIDITGKPESICRERDSNLGRVGIRVGGVGHNIAMRLSSLGYKAELVTAIGSGFHAGMVRESCRKANVSLAHTYVGTEHTGTYIGIFDEDGDMPRRHQRYVRARPSHAGISFRALAADQRFQDVRHRRQPFAGIADVPV